MKKLLSSLIVSAAVIGGCSSNGRLSGISPVEELPMNSFRQEWYRDLGLKDEKVKALYFRGDEVYVHSEANRFYALNAAGGGIKFVAQIGNAKEDVSEPLVQPDRVVVAAGQYLKFFDRTGRLDRTLDLNEPIRTGIAGSERGLYAGQDHRGGGRLIAIDPAYQHNPIRWQLDAGGGVYGTPAVLGANVFFGGLDGHVYALDVDRRMLWPQLPDGVFKTGGAIYADTRLSGNELIVASMDTKLYSIDPRSGKLRWTCFAGVPLRSSPEATKEFVYQYAPGKGILAVSRAEGEPMNRPAKWTIAEARQFLAEDEKYAYLRSNKNRILAVEKISGEVMFRSVRKDLVAFASNTKDGTIYAATRDGLVLGIKPVLRPGTVGQLALDVTALGTER